MPDSHDLNQASLIMPPAAIYLRPAGLPPFTVGAVAALAAGRLA